ncbi:MAG TPA: tetratricopeptide repeat protein, partial [Allocoleopsis sp.]
MYRQTLLAVSTLCLAGIGLTAPVTQALEAQPAASSKQPAIARTLIAQANSSNSEALSQLLKEGRKRVDAGDLSGAIAIYQQAASLDGKNAKIFSGIGYLQARQGNFPAAAAAYRQAVALDGKNTDFLYALGYSLANSGDNSGAAAAYRQAVALDGKNTEAYLGL